ncbi:MAG TPA: cobalamin-binding protein [Candidatus Acidoferrales bacterium]|nr:cobalamin-binding protein [Candidatus Acidoferrales bacterium]
MRADEHGRRTGPAAPLLAAALLCLPLTLSATERPTRTVVDQTGRVLRLPTRIERVVSLAPSLTEIVYALGLEGRLVGVTNLCDFPPAARAKPKVGDVLNPSLEGIIELRPDVVLGTTAGNRRETVEALERAGIPLYGVEARTVEEILASIQDVAELLGVPEAGEALAKQMRTRLAVLAARLQQTQRPRVLFVLWLEPLLTVGSDTFLNDVLSRAGAESVTANLHQDWPRLSLEFVIERDPDYLVLPRTFGLEAALARLAEGPPWGQVRAVEERRIVWLEDAVLRPGPRIVEAIEELARALHPEIILLEAATN